MWGNDPGLSCGKLVSSIAIRKFCKHRGVSVASMSRESGMPVR